MSKSDIVPLCQELRKLIRRDEMHNIKMKELKNTLTQGGIGFVLEIDSLKEELKERDRRLAVYESEHMSSSSSSSTVFLHDAEHVTFQKEREEKTKIGNGIDCENDVEFENDAETKNKGTAHIPHKDHIRVSPDTKADIKIILNTSERCKYEYDTLQSLNLLVKMVYDFCDNNLGTKSVRTRCSKQYVTNTAQLLKLRIQYYVEHRLVQCWR